MYSLKHLRCVSKHCRLSILMSLIYEVFDITTYHVAKWIMVFLLLGISSTSWQSIFNEERETVL